MKENPDNKYLKLMNFGDVVRYIAHEFIHMNDRLGQNESKRVMDGDDVTSKAEREFRAYHLMYSERFNKLPSVSGGSKLYNLRENAKIYNLMLPDKQTYYKPWLENEKKFIETVKYTFF